MIIHITNVYVRFVRQGTPVTHAGALFARSLLSRLSHMLLYWWFLNILGFDRPLPKGWLSHYYRNNYIIHLLFFMSIQYEYILEENLLALIFPPRITCRHKNECSRFGKDWPSKLLSSHLKPSPRLQLRARVSLLITEGSCGRVFIRGTQTWSQIHFLEVALK